MGWVRKGSTNQFLTMRSGRHSRKGGTHRPGKSPDYSAAQKILISALDTAALEDLDAAVETVRDDTLGIEVSEVTDEK